MTTEIINKIEGIESALQSFQDKANEEIKNAGKVSEETKNALDSIATQQREIADRMLALEQSGSNSGGDSAVKSAGQQFVDNGMFKNYLEGQSNKVSVEVNNAALTGSDATVAPDRKQGVVGGAFQPLTLEAFLTTIPTASNAIEYTRETVFTNNAAEVAEGTASAETTIGFGLEVMPISNVSHDTPISKQLASDNASLAAYINTRMMYGVDLKVEQQLANGTGVTPVLSGLLKSGNFTAHGYTAALLGSVLPKHVLIRRMIADAWLAGYPADAVVMNPSDFADLEIEALTTSAGQSRLSTNAAGQPVIFGIPVVQSIGVPIDQLLVGAFAQSATVHDRQSTIIETSDSHGTTFIEGVITIKATRRLALTVERPAGIIAGDLTPL